MTAHDAHQIVGYLHDIKWALMTIAFVLAIMIWDRN